MKKHETKPRFGNPIMRIIKPSVDILNVYWENVGIYSAHNILLSNMMTLKSDWEATNTRDMQTQRAGLPQTISDLTTIGIFIFPIETQSCLHATHLP